MKASLKKIIVGLLLVPVIAALGSVGAFYWYHELDKGGPASFEQIGQLRILSEQLHNHTHMLLFTNNDYHRKRLKEIIRKFDNLIINFDSITELTDSYSYSNHSISERVHQLRKSWQRTRPIIGRLIESNGANVAAWEELHEKSHIPNLPGSVENLARTYQKYENQLHEVMVTFLVSVFFINLLLLVFAVIATRLFSEGQKESSAKIDQSLQEQQTLSAVLSASLSDKPLAEQLGDVLDEVFKLPNLSVNPRGCIFLVDDNKPFFLIMVAQRNVGKEICTACNSVAYGKCLCGRAALLKKMVVSKHIDSRHEITVPNMKPHGHVCMPIKSTDKLLGVMNLYLEDGYELTEDDSNFLNIIIHGLALIIHKKNAEAEVLQSEQRFRSLVETSSDWIWETDELGVYTYASPQVEQLLGYKPEEIIGLSPFELMPPGEAEHTASVFQGFADLHKPFSLLENINRHKNGGLVVLETSGVPIFDSDHKFRGYRGVDRDITERKQSEEVFRAISEGLAMVTGEAFFGTMVRHLSSSLDMDYALFAHIKDHEQGILETVSVWVEDRHVDNFEYTLAGTPCENVLQTGLCVYPKNVQDLFPSCGLLEGMDVQGYVGVPVVGSSGEVIGFLAVMNKEPISKQLVVSSMLQIFAVRVAAEYERVQRENQRLEHEKKQKETLVREVHHRIKNNLQGVAGLLRHHIGDNDDLGSVLNTAISQIHSVAMMYGLQSDASDEDILLGPMINAIVENARGLTQASVDSLSDEELVGIEKVSSKEAVPLALVLNELIFNAIKHCGGSSEGRHVRVYLQRQADFVEVHICNVGQLPENFDFESGKGISTGLTLIRSLLPKNGASLKYRELNGVVMAELRLAEPVLKLVVGPKAAVAS